eukprot:4216356-Pleurochrysis_carterae.AAC.2
MQAAISNNCNRAAATCCCEKGVGPHAWYGGRTFAPPGGSARCAPAAAAALPGMLCESTLPCARGKPYDEESEESDANESEARKWASVLCACAMAAAWLRVRGGAEAACAAPCWRNRWAAAAAAR